jgi:uncharacterized protein YlxW (UPF0749 family)
VAEHTSGDRPPGGTGVSWRDALRRAEATLLPRRGEKRPGWSLLVPLIAALAGLLFTTTARTAGGTSLRDDRRPELTKLIEERQAQVDGAAEIAKGLRRSIDAQTSVQAGSDVRVAEQQARANAVRAEAGLTALHGPGVTVRLDDAPRRPGGGLPPGARPDDVVVHQQDVQSVVNALWAGGAEAMTIMGVRVISTSAVRCVGNTLLLHGRNYSPPFEITAIGDPNGLRAVLDADSGVRLFRDAVHGFGLGYVIRTESDVTVPAYDASVTLDLAEATR